ncbi:ComEA family DNA-binding protein [Streptomyces sp. NPDC046821]|uniref:ComEA family DNA-binding protein n=1 Tax=Streptomyces sp. NPDC046821 TaxID=3154702 RepID=UPI0033DAA6C8
MGTRYRRGRLRRRYRQESAEALRLRAEALFAQRHGGRQGGSSAQARRVRSASRPLPRWARSDLDEDGVAGEVRGGLSPGAARSVRGGVTDALTAGLQGEVTGRLRDGVPGEGAEPGVAPAAAWRERAAFAVRERMPLWMQTRCGLERRSVVALVVVLVAAAGFAVHHFWTGRAQPVRAPEVVRSAAPEEAAGPPEPAEASQPPAGPTGVAASAGAEIVVDVSGKVRSPGILRLPAGSRVADALRAAGGIRPGVDPTGINRARLLADGEQVVVGAPAAPGGAGAGAAGAAGTGAAPAGPIGLNTATVDQLDTLPGVGPVLAQHIIDYRTEHGGFRSVDELREVNGIGDRRFSDLQNLVRP